MQENFERANACDLVGGDLNYSPTRSVAQDIRDEATVESEKPQLWSGWVASEDRRDMELPQWWPTRLTATPLASTSAWATTTDGTSGRGYSIDYIWHQERVRVRNCETAPAKDVVPTDHAMTMARIWRPARATAGRTRRPRAPRLSPGE